MAMYAPILAKLLKEGNTIKSRSDKVACRNCDNMIDFQEYQKNLEDPGLCFDCALKAKMAYARNNIGDLLKKVGVPLRYLHCSLDNFLTDTSDGSFTALIKVKSYLQDAPIDEGLFLTGSNGTGKTHLAIAVLRQKILAGWMRCRFIKVPELLFEIREHIQSDRSEKEAIDRFRSYDYLVLDELGVEKVSEWALQDLYLILDGRSGNMKPTTITSNLSLEEVESTLSSRFASRIVEMCRIIEMNYADYRILTRAKKVKR